jgi:micrococcal nuclease
VTRGRPERLLGALLVVGLVAAVVIGVGLVERPAPATPSGDAPAGESADVTHVTDGDTIVVVTGGTRERVRYIGLDAPELANARTGAPAECGAEAARDANAGFVDGATVILERDASDRDRFGRLLRHVWVADGDAWRLVGEELIVLGAVEARSYAPDTARDATFDAAERRAHDANLGIWGSC